jgi:hypothetical protein
MKLLPPWMQEPPLWRYRIWEALRGYRGIATLAKASPAVPAFLSGVNILVPGAFGRAAR